jgi:tetratricopeptide (TPR) repeat protein
VVFAALVIGAAGVVFVLPELVAEPGEAPPPAEASASPPETAVAEPGPERSDEARAEAERLLDAALKQQARVENAGARIWGGERLVTSYPEALASLEEADRNFEAERFDLAIEGYREALERFEQLASSRDERLAQALRKGGEALEKPDAEAAKNHYEIALALDRENGEAKRGLERAANLPRAVERLEQARSEEATGQLEAARRLYEEAVAIDGESRTARDELRRLESSIEERDYERAVSGALAALNQNDVDRAKRSLQVAGKLRPGARKVRDLERQLGSIEAAGEMRRLSQQGARFEREERWDEAARVYERALKLDANAAFARRGKARAERIIQLNKEIDRVLANPEQLGAPGALERAREMVELASSEGADGAKLRAKAAELDELLDAYTRPISVVLRSDGMTYVVIQRVARLGPFLEHRLKLRSGRYTLVGRRSGYRDVRVELVVPIAGEEMTVSVQCREPV